MQTAGPETEIIENAGRVYLQEKHIFLMSSGMLKKPEILVLNLPIQMQ